MKKSESEIVISYPREWREQSVHAHFPLWRRQFSDQFAEWEELKIGKNDPQFAQYYLMYLLRRDFGFCSIAWYKLCSEPLGSVNEKRTLKYWETMHLYMGRSSFETLQRELKSCGFTNFTGEPDLFCWHPQTGEWFFAEAKAGKDVLGPDQQRWFNIYRAVLPNAPDVRIYRLMPL
jgi:hypothetical protein